MRGTLFRHTGLLSATLRARNRLAVRTSDLSTTAFFSSLNAPSSSGSSSDGRALPLHHTVSSSLFSRPTHLYSLAFSSSTTHSSSVAPSSGKLPLPVLDVNASREHYQKTRMQERRARRAPIVAAPSQRKQRSHQKSSSLQRPSRAPPAVGRSADTSTYSGSPPPSSSSSSSLLDMKSFVPEVDFQEQRSDLLHCNSALFRSMPINERKRDFILRHRLSKHQMRGRHSRTRVPPPQIQSAADRAVTDGLRSFWFNDGGKPKLRPLCTCTESDQFPNANNVEIAFVGRSNVGKSSLLNALSGSSACGVSQKPGHTQAIHWYQLTKEHIRFVDLPGFGFAYATEELRQHWRQLFEVFLERRAAAGSLRRVLLLVDARHGLRESDHQVMNLLDRHRITFQVVLTKTDILSAEELARRWSWVESEMRGRPGNNALTEVILTTTRAVRGLVDIHLLANAQPGILTLRRHLRNLAQRIQVKKH